MADAIGLGPIGRKVMGVRLSPWALVNAHGADGREARSSPAERSADRRGARMPEC